MSNHDFGKKMGRSVLYKEDYRGLNLCVPCWDGLHFIDETARASCEAHRRASPEEYKGCKLCHWKKTGKRLNNCRLGDCECPCSRIEQNRADENYKLRQLKKSNRAAQTSIMETGCGVLDINGHGLSEPK